MSRFFVAPGQVRDGRFELTGDEAHHAGTVLRKRVGDTLELFDGQGHAYQGRIETILPDRLTGSLLERPAAAEPPRETLILCQALIKGPRWDWLVEKAAEIGVRQLLPLRTARTVVRLEPANLPAKQRRWQRIATEACKQCGRADLLEVLAPLSLEEALQRRPAGALDLIPWEKAEGPSIRDAWGDFRGDTLRLFIGPEGGWERAEVESAVRRGARPVSLGRRLLRAETAGLVAADRVLVELEARPTV